MNDYSKMVKEFNDIFSPDSTTNLYKKLILEEFNEWFLEYSSDTYKEEHELKELVDLIYVIYGYAYAAKLNLYVANSELQKINRQIKSGMFHSLILGAYVEWLDSKDNEWLQNLSTACIAYANNKEWPLLEAFRRVHASNMSKLEDGKVLRRKDGKVEKGKDYKPADLKDLIPKRKKSKSTALIIM